MFGQGYVGTSEDVRRIRRQEKQREEEKKKFEELKKQHEANIDQAGLRQFGTATSEVLENAFKNETIGLVTREEFVEKRKTLADRIEDEQLRKKREADEELQREKERQKKLKAEQTRKSKLSFVDDEETNDDADDTQQDAADTNGAADKADASNARKQGTAAALKLGKDPTVPTDFLPDRDREQQEAELRDKLRKEYEIRQRVIKNEPLEVTYSYWNGSGHRRTVTVRKGDTIGVFLAHAKEQLCKDFREVRAMSVSSMMYVKEDIILPHSITFYDLIKSKARGKSGPLFSFDVHDDVRLQSDARIETTNSHAGKVVDRHWYDKNKHIYPASRWETYDTEKMSG